jgi:molecular chaperone DnaJ
MNSREAHQILGVSEGSDKEVVKKAFRKLAAKYHPDVNKDPGAEEQFKKINQAWQVIENPPPEPTSPFGSGWQSAGFNINLNDLFGGSNGTSRKKIIAQDITLQQTLSFREAALGCVKEIIYSHNVRCIACDGAGQKTLDNGCDVCRGAGKIRSQNGNTIVERACHKCRGKLNYEDCSKCHSNGYTKTETTISVNIPPGAVEGSILNLGSRGNYFGSLFGMEQNSNLALHIHVIPQAGLLFRENDVVCSVPISLLEALEGTTKIIPTIDGDKEINIPKLIRHKEEISLPNLGVGRKGKQIAVVQISYPENVSKLIEALKEEAQ